MRDSWRFRLPWSDADLLFFAFCAIVFSKVAWYDLRVYWPAADRRDLLTGFFVAWVIAQGALYLTMMPKLVRRLRWPAALWILATAPYLLIGAIDHGFNLFLLADVARYGMPVAFLAFFSWAVEKVPPRKLILGIGASLGTYMVVRTAIHLLISNGAPMRYGIHWEVFPIALLIASALALTGARLVGLLLATAGMTGILLLGLSRALLGGMCVAAVVVTALVAGTRLRRRGLRVGMTAAVAIAMAGLPMVLQSSPFKRLRLAGVIADADPGSVLPGWNVEPRAGAWGRAPVDVTGEVAAPPDEESVAGARSGEVPVGTSTGEPPAGTPDPLDGIQPGDGGLPDQVEAARRRLEHAMQTGSRSMDVRIAEAVLFGELIASDWRTILWGAGGGGYIIVTTPRQDRLVRAPHNTPLALVYRHGLVLGGLLFVVLAVYGLPTHVAQLRHAESVPWAILLAALVSYRVAVIFMAQLHQGLFDDPLVFLSIAVARSPAARQ